MFKGLLAVEHEEIHELLKSSDVTFEERGSAREVEVFAVVLAEEEKVKSVSV